MEELRECIKIINENFLKRKHEKVVFWKNCDNSWSTFTFHLHCNKIHAGEKSYLEFIQKCDPKAVIVDVDDFVEANGDGSILVDDMVSSVLYLYIRGQANISDFLDYYADKEAQQDVMTTKEIIKIMEKRLKQLANYERFELSNGNSTSTEILEIAKFLIGAKTQGLGWEE